MSREALRALYIHDLGELHGAERLRLEVLPRWLERCSDTGLRRVLETSAAQAPRRIRRIEKLFDLIRYQPGAPSCPEMERLITRAADVLTIPSPHARDRQLIEVARRVQRWLIASYLAAVQIAGLLGERGASVALRHSLEEDTAAGRRLDRMAEAVPGPTAAPARGAPAVYRSLRVH